MPSSKCRAACQITDGASCCLASRKTKQTLRCRDEAVAHLPPLEPLNVEVGESEALLPAGTISSILEGTIVVQVCPSLAALSLVPVSMSCANLAIIVLLLHAAVSMADSRSSTHCCDALYLAQLRSL